MIFNKYVPMYIQIVEEMKLRIASGTLKKGDKISAVRVLSVEFTVNPNTVQKALMMLDELKICNAANTSGRFVTTDEKVISELKNELIKKYTEEYLEKLNRIGLNTKSIEKYVEENRDEFNRN